MNNMLKLTNNDHLKVLIVAGCEIEFTPVVKSYIKYAKENNYDVDTVEYKNYKRAQFIIHTFFKIIRKKYSKIICVNHQSLPIIFVLSWLSSSRIFFWKLESYKLFENMSIALNLQLLEFLLNRRSVTLLLPTTIRAKIQFPKYHLTYVLPNAPIRPYSKKSYSSRKLNHEKINLVIYGTINKDNSIFLNEWISFCKKFNNYNLTVIGKNGFDANGVNWKGKLKHDLLINELTDHKKFNFSLVGYRATSQNNKYAAPNKLLESLACGLPVIGHAENQYVVDLISEYECGLIVNFENLDSFVIDISQEQYEKLIKGANNAADRLCLSNAVLDTPLRCD